MRLTKKEEEEEPLFVMNSMKYKNNPLNIRYNPANNWQGQDKPLKSFCQFKSLFYGYRAAIKLITRYRSFGCVTLGQIISRWAPESDGNRTEDYVRFVASKLRCGSDHVVTDDDLFIMLHAMTIIEQGVYDFKFDKALENCLYQLNLPVVKNENIF